MIETRASPDWYGRQLVLHQRNRCCINVTRIPEYEKYFPQPTSSKNVEHFSQSEFSFHDFGPFASVPRLCVNIDVDFPKVPSMEGLTLAVRSFLIVNASQMYN
jgi:hypothetical protein